MKTCKICDTETNTRYNIDFEAIPICNKCGKAIFIQQAQWYVEQENKFNNSDKIDKLRLAAAICVIEDNASIGLLQRKMKLTHSESASIINQLEDLGIIDSSRATIPRKILINDFNLVYDLIKPK